jgi:hypothetical protein
LHLESYLKLVHMTSVLFDKEPKIEF